MPASIYSLCAARTSTPEDAYSDILPDLPRDVAKKAFNAMINAEAPMLAQPRGMKLSQYGYRWQDVVKAMFDRHWAIKDAFFSGAGKYLQRIDRRGHWCIQLGQVWEMQWQP